MEDSKEAAAIRKRIEREAQVDPANKVITEEDLEKALPEYPPERIFSARSKYEASVWSVKCSIAKTNVELRNMARAATKFLRDKSTMNDETR